MDLLGACSRESIYQRFRHFFQWQSHEAAVRYCFNDYDRELAIVAEAETDGKRRLLGVGRLIADPDHESAEYAVLVADAWQNRGLGRLLTSYCLEIAREWGVKEVTAQTHSDNPRMVKVFSVLGFDILPDADGSLVEVRKRLG
jgi:acetyltransferase